jgi:hypothetical protein
MLSITWQAMDETVLQWGGCGLLVERYRVFAFQGTFNESDSSRIV